jgi:hypothetical protein
MPLPVLQAWNAGQRRHPLRLGFGQAKSATGLLLGVVACTFALLACPERPNAASAAPAASSTEQGVPAVPPAGQVVPSIDEGRVIDLTGGGGANGSTSDLHPLEGADHCVEMDTVCVPEGQSEKCTSARFELTCGEAGKIPSTGEHVRCVCP